MEHKIFKVEFEIGSEEEKNKSQIGTITSTDGKITAIDNSGGELQSSGWSVGGTAPIGDLYLSTISSS